MMTHAKPPRRLAVAPVASLALENVFVVRYRNLRWEVAHNGVTRHLVDWLFSKERAIEHALECAQEVLSAPGAGSARVVVEEVDGGEVLVAETPRADWAVWDTQIH